MSTPPVISYPGRTKKSDKRMRVYLSGPVSHMPDLNRAAFAEAQAALEAAGYEVINPLNLSGATDWHVCMREDIKALMDCDAVAVLDGWERSRGAKIEVNLATRLDMPVRHWQQWVREAQA